MYDIIILGGGPAGLNAALYAVRSNLKVLIISNLIGGAIGEAHNVENWLGTKSITGMELVNNFREHAEEQGVEIKQEEVKGVRANDSGFVINGDYECKKVIIALGTERRKLAVDDEENFLGKGVSYCATCDGAFFRDKIVGVVGGANAAADAALLLADIASKVYIIYRKDKLRAEAKRVSAIEKNEKIECLYGVNVKEMKGEAMLKSVVLDDGKELELDGLFVEIGSVPAVTLAKELGVELCENGCIKVDSSQRTNVKGIYAAGDITNGSDGFRQVITAAAEGAIAAKSVFKDIKE